jgi:hypothetical protein
MVRAKKSPPKKKTFFRLDNRLEKKFQESRNRLKSFWGGRIIGTLLILAGFLMIVFSSIFLYLLSGETGGRQIHFEVGQVVFEARVEE